MDLAITPYQQEAGKILRTSSSIKTADQLAVYRMSGAPRYKGIPETQRRRWLAYNIGAICLILHQEIPPFERITIDADSLDSVIMDDPALSNLTQLEMQDAFRTGLAGAYGDYYGVTTKSLFGFLQRFLESDKKVTAHRIISRQEDKSGREADERFWRELQEAKARGDFKPSWGPDFNFRNKVSPEDSEAHKAKIKAQAEQIYKNEEI